MNIAVPKPVPKVTTSSRPEPETTAAPWTSASLATRVGTFKATLRAAARSKRSQAPSSFGSTGVPGPPTVTKCGALSTTPRRTIPGKPTAARSAGGRARARLTRRSTMPPGPSGGRG